jgi:hypothetical protein
MNKQVPYNTGKVQIGINYVPPRRIVDLGADAELLQLALLKKRASLGRRLFARWFSI